MANINPLYVFGSQTADFLVIKFTKIIFLIGLVDEGICKKETAVETVHKINGNVEALFSTHFTMISNYLSLSETVIQNKTIR